MKKVKYELITTAHQNDCENGWWFAAFPKELSEEIRNNFQWKEEGWGRLKVTASIGETEWETSIWYDTKHGSYWLPLKAEVRRKERIKDGDEIRATVLV